MSPLVRGLLAVISLDNTESEPGRQYLYHALLPTHSFAEYIG
jgi:hypothetical protein